MSKPVTEAVARWADEDRRHRAREAGLRALGLVVLVVGIGVLGSRFLPAWATAAAAATAIAAGAWHTRHTFTRSIRSAHHIARAVEGQRELLRTAMSIEAGTAAGGEHHHAAILAEAGRDVERLTKAAVAPTERPRELLPLLGTGLLLTILGLFIPVQLPTAEPTLAAAPHTPDAPAPPAPEAVPDTVAVAPTSDGQQSARGLQEGGSGSQSPTAGTASGTGAGAQGAAGQSAAGDAPGAEADATSRSESTGTAQADARAGSATTTGAQGDTTRPPESAASRTTTDRSDAAAPTEEAPTLGIDGVELTRATNDTVVHNGEVLHLTEDDLEGPPAETRSVAGTLDIQSDRMAGFAEDDEDVEDGEEGEDGKGGWTVGLSQPGQGGVNDASGSTWRTEAAVPPPEDLDQAPTEWVDAAWQEGPDGVVRRVEGGDAGGRASLDYQEAWLQYSAVAEAQTSDTRVPPGRQDYVKRYFLAIAPPPEPQ